MATIQLKRGVEADRSSVTPASGEMLYTTDTKLVYVGDGSTAGGNPVGVGGGNVLEATASGALANGDLVIVNSDGTVSAVAGSSVSEATGTPAIFESAFTFNIAATYDANAQKIVIAYRDNSNSDYGTAVVGTVSGTSISFGTPVVFNSANTSDKAITYDANAQKVVIAYQDRGNSFYGTAIVGTVSGTSISFGSATVFESAGTYYVSATYDSANGKIVIPYRDAGNSYYGTAVVGTVSGTSISFGTPVVFESADTLYCTAIYDSNTQSIVIAYSDSGNGSYATAIVGTVSGTSISFGTATVVESTASSWFSGAYDSSAQKVVISYRGLSGYGTAAVGTVSGTAISFGAAVVFESASIRYTAAAYHEAAQMVVIAYEDLGNASYGTVISGTVSGTSISFGTPAVFESSNTYNCSATYDSNAQMFVVAYTDYSNGRYGTAAAYTPAYTATNLTASNYIGISDGAYADTATATIQVKGSVDDAQSSLTAGQAYYVQTDGTLSTTPDSPSVLAGTAVSATEIIVKG